MKKIYFIITSLLLFVAMQANAQVTSIADLYGNYKFRADVEFTTEGESYREILLTEADATISKSGIYDAQIIGFAGSETPLGINAKDLSNNTIEMANPNSPQLWNGLLLANKNGDNPGGVNNDGKWEVMPYNSEIYTFNPKTKEILIPDFTVVKKSNNSIVIIAKYTNVKMTYISSNNNEENETPESTFEWAGEYTLTAAKVSSWDGGSYPAEFKVTIEYNTEWQMHLLTEFMDTNIADLNEGGILLTPAQDGKTATLDPGFLMSVSNGVFMKLRDANGQLNPLILTVNNDGTISIDDFSLVKGAWDSEDGNSAMASYYDVTASKEGQEGGTPESSFDWTGEYSFQAEKVDVLYKGEGVEFPAEFDLTISYFDGTEYGMPSTYYISSFLGQNIEQMPIDITIAEDGKSAEMLVGGICGMIEAEKRYYTIYDMNATDTPVLMTLNEDGTVSIDNFFIKVMDYTDNSETNGAYYQDIVITKKGGDSNDEDENSIENVTIENSTVIYDLAGRRVKEITNAGIYIINGKKQVIK